MFLARAREPGAVEKCRETDPLLSRASDILAFEAVPLLVIAAQFERTIHELPHVHLLGDHLADRERLALPDEIPPAKFMRLEPYDFRHPVKVPFERKNTLRRPECAQRAVRWHVGATARLSMRTFGQS